MSVPKRRKGKPEAETEKLEQSLWAKAITPNSAWEDKDEFLDIIYWFRQIIAILFGFVWGFIPLKGLLGIGLFCIINSGVIYLYFNNFHGIDEEEYGGAWELTKEGFLSSFALFLVAWVFIYSGVHFP